VHSSDVTESLKEWVVTVPEDMFIPDHADAGGLSIRPI
jgi:hypothetical protein